MHIAFLYVATILFVLDGIIYWTPNATWGGRLQSIGLAFFAASFAVPGG